MREFMMLFRHVPVAGFIPSQEQIEQEIQKWQNWIGGLAAQEKFVQTNQLGREARLVKPDQVISDGPYAEVKEILGGYVIVKANDFEEAVELAKGCPILIHGGHVEIRDFVQI